MPQAGATGPLFTVRFSAAKKLVGFDDKIA
jgi:hypothetical protein